jgi:hypothetical protein
MSRKNVVELVDNRIVSRGRLRASRAARADSRAAIEAAHPLLDFKKLEPAARMERLWRHGPRPLYRNTVLGVQALAESSDLNDPEEFHSLLWMAIRLGGSQKFVADDQSVSPTIVSRWVKAVTSPEVDRRRGILDSALLSLRRAIERGSPVPLRTFHGRRARVER